MLLFQYSDRNNEKEIVTTNILINTCFSLLLHEWGCVKIGNPLVFFIYKDRKHLP